MKEKRLGSGAVRVTVEKSSRRSCLPAHCRRKMCGCVLSLEFLIWHVLLTTSIIVFNIFVISVSFDPIACTFYKAFEPNEIKVCWQKKKKKKNQTMNTEQVSLLLCGQRRDILPCDFVSTLRYVSAFFLSHFIFYRYWLIVY